MAKLKQKLEVLMVGCDNANYGTMLTPITIAKLPQTTSRHSVSALSEIWW